MNDSAAKHCWLPLLEHTVSIIDQHNVWTGTAHHKHSVWRLWKNSSVAELSIPTAIFLILCSWHSQHTKGFPTFSWQIAIHLEKFLWLSVLCQPFLYSRASINELPPGFLSLSYLEYPRQILTEEVSNGSIWVWHLSSRSSIWLLNDLCRPSHWDPVDNSRIYQKWT